MFELLQRDGFGRRGRLETPHGTLRTPTILPVVHPDPARQSVPPSEIASEFGFQGIISSSYLLRRAPHLRERAVSEGLHRFLGFPGAIMTDSGAFQQHSWGQVDVTPDEILEFQNAIGTDIATVLDEFIEPEATFEVAQRGVDTTLERAREARRQRGERLLAVPVQGGLFPDLRERSAKGSSPLADVLAVGGIVPLMEHYRLGDLASVLAAVRPHLAPERPVHLFGLGHPMLFALGALFGGDLFDSSSYHKFARRGTLLFPEGSVQLEELREEICGCTLCGKVPLLSLRERPEEERERHLARHNLEQCRRELARVHQAIRDGELWELAERRSVGHPAVAAALDVARQHGGIFLPVEPPSRRSLRLVVPGSRERPSVRRFHEHLTAWRHGRPTLGNVPARPLSPASLRNAPALAPTAAGAWEVTTPLGPVPLELTELYPVGPLVAPETYAASPERRSRAPPDAEVALPRPEEPLLARPSTPEEATERSKAWVLRHVEGILRWSFGEEAARRLEPSQLRAVHSRNSGRLRQLWRGPHLLFVVGNDGLPFPTFAGGEVLRSVLPLPAGRVVAHEDAVPFVREGRSLFSRHVARADPSLVPDQAVLVVDASDHLLAVGRALLAGPEMGRFARGVAVAGVSHAKSAPTPEGSEPEAAPEPPHAEIGPPARDPPE